MQRTWSYRQATSPKSLPRCRLARHTATVMASEACEWCDCSTHAGCGAVCRSVRYKTGMVVTDAPIASSVFWKAKRLPSVVARGREQVQETTCRVAIGPIFERDLDIWCGAEQMQQRP